MKCVHMVTLSIKLHFAKPKTHQLISAEFIPSQSFRETTHTVETKILALHSFLSIYNSWNTYELLLHTRPVPKAANWQPKGCVSFPRMACFNPPYLKVRYFHRRSVLWLRILNMSQATASAGLRPTWHWRVGLCSSRPPPGACFSPLPAHPGRPPPSQQALRSPALAALLL